MDYKQCSGEKGSVYKGNPSFDSKWSIADTLAIQPTVMNRMLQWGIARYYQVSVFLCFKRKEEKCGTRKIVGTDPAYMMIKKCIL